MMTCSWNGDSRLVSLPYTIGVVMVMHGKYEKHNNQIIHV